METTLIIHWSKLRFFRTMISREANVLLMRPLILGPHDSPAEYLSKTANDLIISKSKMVLSTKEFFNQKVIKELHVGGSKSESGINTRVKCSALFKFTEICAKSAAKVVGQALEHLTKMAVFELQDVYV